MHARLGVTIQGVSQALADSFGLEKAQGALMSAVAPKSAAARAGLQVGDVIIRANDKPIVDSDDLPALVDQLAPGDRITLEVWRKSARREVVARLGEATEAASVSASESPAVQSRKLGLAVRPLTAEERAEANVAGGLVVEDAQGAAARAGIEPGDIVLALNGTPVKSVQQLRELVRKSPKDFALLIQRGEARNYVPVHVG